ncbi:hypothetical protein CR513_62395, partial [Mucuna pruriens]
MNDNIWYLVSVTRGDLRLSHLFIANDVLLFCREFGHQMHLVFSTLKVDILKICLLWGVGSSRIKALSTIIGIKHPTTVGKYLHHMLTKQKCKIFNKTGYFTSLTFCPYLFYAIVLVTTRDSIVWLGNSTGICGWLLQRPHYPTLELVRVRVKRLRKE